jgi:HD-GYP domain-containing protein (c-di-GMP phosphodiesterase class II)
MPAQETTAGDDAQLYNSRIIDTYIKLLKAKYPHVNVGELLHSAGMTSYEVADQGHWFTQSQINRFHDTLARLTRNENIAREAGRYAASPDAIGAMRQYALGMAGPEKAYAMIGKAAANFSKTTTFTARPVSATKVEITVRIKPGIQECSFQCENRKGFLEAIAMAFTNKLPHLEHPECVFKGAPVCRYLISWDKSFSVLWKRFRTFMALAFVLIGIGLVTYFPALPPAVMIPVTATVFLILTLAGESLEKAELKRSLGNLWDSTEKLVDQITVNYNNAIMTNEIGQVVSCQTEVADVLAKVVQISEKRLDFDRGLILLANPERTRLEYRAGFGYDATLAKMVKLIDFRLDNPESQGIFVVSFREKKPYLVNNTNAIEENLSPRSLEFARKTQSRSFICCPIISEGQSIGIFAVDNVFTKRPLVQSDMSLIIGIASVIGISLKNLELLRGKERLFRSLVRVLATSIDARDPMTAGHSDQVTEHALGICGELGLSNEYKGVIRVAALLHDYGKIGIPDAILKKPGKLTPQEYDIVKTHARRTREILNHVDFEGTYQEVPAIAGGHHEKYDGSGYPDGLKGDAIPLGARIIAVADFFEAITARRHYRQPMTVDIALQRLEQNAGSAFDPQVVAAFLRYYQKTFAAKRISLAS